MRNINHKKLNGNNQRHIYEMWEYDICSLDLNNNKNAKALNNRFSGNEIFAFCLIVVLLSIGFGGSYFIRNRTQQKLIYNSIPQVSSTMRQ